MFTRIRCIKICLFLFVAAFNLLSADNQTPTLSPIFPGEELPFQVSIEQADFSLPTGLQSFVYATHNGKWLLLCGRTNGLHGFNDDPNNFPPDTQNTTVYVVDPLKGKVYSRSLKSRHSGLAQDQIDILSVTASQFYQSGKRLYITGGYGYRNSIQNYTTFDSLTAIDVPGLMKWVIRGSKVRPASSYIRQIFDPVFKVTGGAMDKLRSGEPTLLVLGQDFEGAYFFGDNSQVYTNEIRRFNILDNGITLGVKVLPSLPMSPDPSFRRRDLNVVPVLSKAKGRLTRGLVALSGVFTETTGAWTVPVLVAPNGSSFMPNPDDPNTFKQGMNNYNSAVVGLYSRKTGDMYNIICGGLSLGTFVNGSFVQDNDLPFTNQVTTIRIDKTGLFKQFFMQGEYPVIVSTQSNPGNPLLFGTSAAFIPSASVLQLSPEVISLDRLRDDAVVGYIIGGIQSTVPDTSSQSDSAASPYIFKVRVLRSSESSH